MKSIFDPERLHIFSADEFEMILVECQGTFSAGDLDNIKTDHGYSKDSLAVQMFLKFFLNFLCLSSMHSSSLSQIKHTSS